MADPVELVLDRLARDAEAARLLAARLDMAPDDVRAALAAARDAVGTTAARGSPVERAAGGPAAPPQPPAGPVEPGAQAQLRASQERVRTMIEQAPVSIQIFAPDGRTLQVNPAWERLWGVTLDQIGGYNILEDAQLEAKGVMPYIRRAFAGRASGVPPIKYEPTETVAAHGAVPYRWVSAFIFPIKDAPGAVREVVLVHQDITERMETEAALRESQARLQAILDNAPAVIYVKDTAGRYVLVNRRFEELFHLTGEQAQGKTDHDIFQREIADALVANDRQVLRDGLPMAWEEAAPLDDGLHTYISLKVPMRDAEGRLSGICGISTDITERIRAEQRQRFLADAGQILTASLDYETTLAAVARSAVPALGDYCVIDVIQDDGSVERVSSAHVNPDKAELMHALRDYPPDLATNYPVASVLRTGQPRLVPEMVPRWLDDSYAGNPAYVRLLRALAPRALLSVPLLARGRILGAMSWGVTDSVRRYTDEDLALAEDLARRAAQAVDNAQLYREAQTAIRSRDEFLAVAAHELKTPITSLRGYAQIVLRQLDRGGTTDPARLRQVMTAVDQQSGRLAELVGQLLDVARIEAGKLVLAPQLTDLVPLARDVAALAQQGTDRHTITLDAPGSLSAVVDPLRVEQVLANLLDNAVKFSPQGGPIEIELARAGADVRLAVRDHGIGIPAERHTRIFDRFYRSDAAASPSGMGLGLWISDQIVRLHGGDISVACPPDGGTRFSVALPARPGVEAPPAG